jgi:hypothetical protein
VAFNPKHIIQGHLNRAKKALGILDENILHTGEYRLTICGECPQKQSFLFNPICKICGCKLAEKVLSDSPCPLYKW